MLEKQLQVIQEKITRCFPLMRGSVVTIGIKDKQPKFSLSLKGKTRLLYLGKRKELIAKKWSDNYKKVLGLIDEMTFINMELLRRMEVTGGKGSDKQQ